MRRLPRWSLLALSVVAAAAVAVGVGAAWNQRAGELCREDAPAAASGYTVRWEWDELAYVCDYDLPSEQPRRIGIVDAFHGEGRRHGPGR